MYQILLPEAVRWVALPKVSVFTSKLNKVATWAQILSGKGSIWTSGYMFKLAPNTLTKETELFKYCS
jgi:hypothetical protein